LNPSDEEPGRAQRAYTRIPLFSHPPAFEEVAGEDNECTNPRS
jgi:hypothetical protein